jgi:protein-disulfide isomerase
VVIEYSEFECPFCARFAIETMPELKRRYIDTGHIQLVFRHLPLPFHATAMLAAQTAECAGEQTRFWEMHDLLFRGPRAVNEDIIRRYARQIGLDESRFSTCVAGPVIEKVRAEAEVSKLFAGGGTPAFLFGRRQADGRMIAERRLSGAKPVEAFVRIIDDLLARPR